MKSNNKRYLFFLIIWMSFSPLILHAEDKRVIPLDMYLIIDGSTSLENSKIATFAWINDQVVDRILMEDDKISIWSAGDKAELIHSGTVTGTEGKKNLKDRLQTMETNGKTADFSGALRNVASMSSQISRDRLSYTMLIAASAAGLEPSLSGSAQGLFRWFRSEKFQQWQVLVVAPDIGKKVQQTAAAYMSQYK